MLGRQLITSTHQTEVFLSADKNLMILIHLILLSMKQLKETKIFIIKLNKRHMGHMAQPRKQFKSINTYDYIITMIQRRKNPLSTYLPLENGGGGPHSYKLESPAHKDAMCQVWLKPI